MATYSFKSSGTSLTDSVANNANSTPSVTQFGVITPLSRGNDNQMLKMSSGIAEQVNVNLKDLLLTNHGERLVLTRFGGNLRVLLSEYTSKEEFDNNAISSIKDAVEKWMSYVDLVDYTSNVLTDDFGSVSSVVIDITYSVHVLKLENKKLRIELKLV